MSKQLLSKEKADALLDEYEEYKKRNEYPVGEHHHIAVPFVIWLKYKKKVTNFPWKLYKEK